MLFILGWDILFSAPLPSPYGGSGILSAFPYLQKQIHGTDAASEDAFASLLFGAGDIMETLPSPDGEVASFAPFHICLSKYTTRMRHLRMPCLRLLNNTLFVIS